MSKLIYIIQGLDVGANNEMVTLRRSSMKGCAEHADFWQKQGASEIIIIKYDPEGDVSLAYKWTKEKGVLEQNEKFFD